ncbi:NAD(P)H-dependent oxidoreductase subunit E [Burkholderia thailandensis]|uniref:Formate dehydrogenase, gamma subunit n=1 Tax=Burkholderia thailandensis (strain ATCC 700388 / DSM 13276 / CCUG 48851 / CIP 106301 / E264) TaxID=271848 RepID=Q2SY37_BURTA|nr:NAD(P)H-dependent oxidoreductase subunit E [Burkholderia thailandensis]ABC39047.1 formate dehydrogenase, gamma subunit [Burkholderia thailandensis E264]AHI71772.1 respiratory-chain NADH dehydrogenase 24 Kd subunit [Burkholderia thailandensis 2002721723]AHI77783.1 respiratory-chain NADH dehydrogenase 24 Kd subunit [Burkholderia thailandensis E444]AIC88083.1 respiratory-chain NADH dehydrogenase 24 Kd subunit [Burkholderia thailandensis USAMRU Malaysia \
MSPNSVVPDTLVRAHAQPGRSLVAILHAIQDDAGYVPPACIEPLAKALNLSRAEVHGVLTYYHHFRTAPPARVTIRLCRAEACRSMGGEALVAHAQARAGCRIDGEHGGEVALESVYCLGLCAQSPSLTINDEPHAKMSPERFDALFDAAVRTKEPA